jgi:hypothetical protein
MALATEVEYDHINTDTGRQCESSGNVDKVHISVVGLIGYGAIWTFTEMNSWVYRDRYKYYVQVKINSASCM